MNNDGRYTGEKKKNKASSGKLLGALLGGTYSGGGFEKAVDPGKLMKEEYDATVTDPNDEDASIDAWNAAQGKHANVQAKPARFQQYQVDNPILDAIFNRGANAAAVSRLNAAGEMAQWQAEQNAALAQAEREAAIQRQVLANQGQLDVTDAQGRNSINEVQARHNSTAFPGIPAANWAEAGQVLAKPRINAAGAEANIIEQFTTDPRFQESIRNRVLAENAKQGAINTGLTKMELQPNSTGFLPMGIDGTGSGPVITPNTVTEQTLTPEYMTLPDGTKIQIGSKALTTHKSTPMVNIKDAEAKRAALLKKAEATAKGQGEAPAPIATPAPVSLPVAKPQYPSAIGPSLPNEAAIPRMMKNFAPNTQSIPMPLPEEPMIDAVIRYLIDSNYKRKIPAAE